MKVALALVFLFFLFTVSGSHYQMQPPPSAAKIAIPLFINKTFKEDLDEILTGEVLNEFMLRANFQIVPEDEAELLLKGEILEYLQEEAVSPGEHKVTVEVKVTLFSLKEDTIVWEKRLREDVVYSPFKVGSIQSEEEAIRDVSRKIGEELVNLTLSKWRS